MLVYSVRKLVVFLRKGLVKMRFYKSLQGALVVSLVVLLPQCDWGKKEDTIKDETFPASASVGAGEVLLTIDGQPRITVDRFENYMNTVLEAQPQLKQLIGLMPDAEMELFRKENEGLSRMRGIPGPGNRNCHRSHRQ